MPKFLGSIDFLVIKDVYYINKYRNFNQVSPRLMHFQHVLANHLYNGLYTYCLLYGGEIERPSPIFENEIIDVILEETAETLSLTRVMFNSYKAYLHQQKVNKQNIIGQGLLNNFIDLKNLAILVSFLITESLQVQIDLVDDYPKFAEFVCKHVLSNVLKPAIYNHLFANTTNSGLCEAVFATTCLMATFIDSPETKSSLRNRQNSKVTQKGLLLHAGIAFAGRDLMHVFKTPVSKIGKYGYREVRPTFWQFFRAVFQIQTTLNEQFVKPSSLLSPIPPAIEAIKHDELDTSRGLSITNVPVAQAVPVILPNESNQPKASTCIKLQWMLSFFNWVINIIKSCLCIPSSKKETIVLDQQTPSLQP